MAEDVIHNKKGDYITVNLGNWGGDNVYGRVFDKAGVWVEAAKVTVINLSYNEVGTDKTGSRGKYDVDVNAARGHKVNVHAEWIDSNGDKHAVDGDVILDSNKVNTTNMQYR